MSFLTLNEVSHYYYTKNSYTKAIDNISFTLKKGEFISILGPSGCGKSTILSIIAGIIKQSEGSVLLNNQPINELPLATGYMLQQDYLFPWKTIINNVQIGLKIKGTNKTQTNQEALDLLGEVGLSEVANAYPDALSGGMRQCASLVRTLIADPEILLLDEPFSALDFITKIKLENLVAKLLKTYKKTAILVTHDIGEAISMSDWIILMDTNPGSIASVVEVPSELKSETPFLVRRHPKYQPLFDTIWNQLNKYEQNNPLLLEKEGLTDEKST